MVSTSLKLFTIAAFGGLVSCTDMESPAPEPGDEVDAVTDSMKPIPERPVASVSEGPANLVGTGPIAYGTISTAGAKLGGTPNWTSTYNAALQRYEITIAGESYFYTSYATVVTSMGSPRICNTDSLGGKLLIKCHDHAGNPATALVAFVTSKP